MSASRERTAADGLASDVASMPWYHTIDLPGGITTPGFYDLRDLPGRLPIPQSLEGKRCLDVGSSTGFWAFEMERRGARSVLSLDLDDGAKQDFHQPEEERTARGSTTGLALRSFNVASSALGSSVERVDASVYDLNEADFGRFDFVFMGNLLLHLRDPIGALIAVRRVTAGTLLSLEPIAFVQTWLHPWRPTAALQTFNDNHWWVPNPPAHRQYLVAGGFRVRDRGGTVRQRFGAAFSTPSVRAVMRTKVGAIEKAHHWAVTVRRGLRTSWVIGS